MLMDNTKKFSKRAENYTKGRPSYAKSFITMLYGELGFDKNSVIADIGSGTGKFSKHLLENGSKVFCVEPNEDMRKIAEMELSHFDNFISVNGTSSDTGLEDNSVDFITVAQAFHWFDFNKFKKECKRILKDNGKVILVWNTRDLSSEFNKKSYDIYKKYCPAFKGFHGGMKDDDNRIYDFFKNDCRRISFENPLEFTKDKFIKRSLSASYSLVEGDRDFEQYVKELGDLFECFSRNGIVIMKNNTVAYIGKLN